MTIRYDCEECGTLNSFVFREFAFVQAPATELEEKDHSCTKCGAVVTVIASIDIDIKPK